MNWFVFVFVAWISFGLEMALRPVFDAGSSGVYPSMSLPLLVFISLYAPRRHAMWGAVLVGLTTDLLSPIVHADGGSIHLLGPFTLGSLLLVQFMLTIRGKVIRSNPITMMVLSIIGASIVQAVVVALITARSLFGDHIVWDASDELLYRFFSCLYTGAAALVLSFGYFALANAFAFHGAVATRYARTMHAR